MPEPCHQGLRMATGWEKWSLEGVGCAVHRPSHGMLSCVKCHSLVLNQEPMHEGPEHGVITLQAVPPQRIHHWRMRAAVFICMPPMCPGTSSWPPCHWSGGGSEWRLPSHPHPTMQFIIRLLQCYWSGTDCTPYWLLQYWAPKCTFSLSPFLSDDHQEHTLWHYTCWYLSGTVTHSLTHSSAHTHQCHHHQYHHSHCQPPCSPLPAPCAPPLTPSDVLSQILLIL